ncbi:hypothetical protein HMN09_00685500 [Mycena chlorophos]|uniref:F-box domain-containing protein n=1 Tax=Mycena chlorophos TaxID=658473 RepID=A0A8H6W790_MYCCL|nr:hypothetical protein HMN09_00685500 [Mycena chlorophos]
MQLQDLPIELLQHIFSFACTDIGTTGRSLSLVSRHVRDVSAAVKLQSVALFGHNQILGFASLLSQNGGHPAHEMDALLCTTRAWWKEAHSAAYGKDAQRLDAEERQRLEERFREQSRLCDEAVRTFCREAADAISVILRRVAPTLEVLFVDVDLDVAEQLEQIRSVALPRLVDLTTGGLFLFPRQQHEEDQVQPNPGPALHAFPSLRHLHVVEEATDSEECSQHLLFKADGLAQFAPNLTCLRLSELRWDSSVVLSAAASLGIELRHHRSYPPYDPESAVPLPESVQRIVMKPMVRPVPVACCDECDEIYIYRDVVNYARRLVCETERVVLLRLKADEERSEPEVVQLGEWLEKARGGMWRWDEESVDTTPPKLEDA